MELVVHGTKGGYRIFFKTQYAPSIGSDIRNNVSSEEALGKSAYSLAFASSGVVFTKYKIIRDTLRSDATGFIAFSLFLLYNEELPNMGRDVKSILDELLDHYLAEYVRNNNINRGEAHIIQEDWSFVNIILGRNKTEQDNYRSNIDIQPGVKESAFVFYENDSKLQELFSKPFQEEYNGYKQILLISEESRNSSTGLLKVLRNSGKEIKIDLNNEPFFLNEYNPNMGLTINANGRPRSNGKNNNLIRAKDIVEIKFIKKYFAPIEETGTLSNRASGVYKYLEIKGNQIKIKYDEFFNNLKPLKKIITFYVKDWKGAPVHEAKISCNYSGMRKEVEINNQITFEGEDLGKYWRISATNDRFYSQEKLLDFENDCPGDTANIDIVLERHKLQINVFDGNGNVKIDNDDLKFSKREFCGSDIEKKHEISISCKGFNTYVFSYDPQNDKIPKEITLTRNASSKEGKTTRSFNVSAGEKGKLKDGNSYISYSIDGSDVRHLIVPNKGYKFKKFETKGDTHKALYYKEDNLFRDPKFIAASIVGVIIIGFGIWMLISLSKEKFGEENQQSYEKHIYNYIQGNSLNLDTLKSYQNLGLTKDEVLKSLDSAIKKRELINTLNFSELKRLSYYPAQKEFETSIDKIDSTRYDDIKSMFGDVSSWGLDQIADSINVFLSTLKPNAANMREEDEKESKESNDEFGEEVTQQEKTKKKGNENRVSLGTKPDQTENRKTDTQPNSKSTTKDIAGELKGSTVNKDDLLEMRKLGKEVYQQSIKLYLQFWELVSDENDQKEAFDNILKNILKDEFLKNSDLKTFLTEICKDSKTFSKYYLDKIKKVPKTSMLNLIKLKSGLSSK